MSRRRLVGIASAAVIIAALAWVFRAQLFGAAPDDGRTLIAGLGLAQVDADAALERVVLWRSDRRAPAPRSILEAIDQNGDRLWTLSVPPAEHGAPLRVCGDTLLIGVSAQPAERDPPMAIMALDPRTGQERWRWDGSATPTAHLGQLDDLRFVGCDAARVYVHARGIRLDLWAWHALDLHSGAQRWVIPRLQTPSTPVVLGASLAVLVRSDARLGVVVEPNVGTPVDIPLEAWPEGGGRVRDVQRAGDQLVGVAFSDARDGCALVTWQPGATTWRPVETSDALPCRHGMSETLFRLTEQHVLTVEADGRRIRALGRRAGARPFEVLNPKPAPASRRVRLARRSTDALDDVIDTRYAPLLLQSDGVETRYQIIVIDTVSAQVRWASEWFPAPRIDHGWRVRRGTVTYVQVQTGAEQASWLGIDGATGRAVGAWGYHFEGVGDTPPQHEEIPRPPRETDWDGHTLHTFYWLAAVAVDVTSGAAGWTQSTYGGQGVVEDRRAAVERRVGPLL